MRELAKQYSLPVADRPDSQDLCFVSQGDYRDFLRKSSPEMMKPGPILDPEGDMIGNHQGLAEFTIGQRKGLGFSSTEPYYVIRKDLSQNALIIGPRHDLGQQEFYADNLNWISGESPQNPFSANVKIRYKSDEVPATITELDPGSALINLESPLPDITPGQAAVFYQNDLCLGGGIIRSN